MSKLMLATVLAAASIGLTSCGSREENDANAALNADEANYSETDADYNMSDMNGMNGMEGMNDMNAVDNAAGNAMDNATGNEAVDGNTGY